MYYFFVNHNGAIIQVYKDFSQGDEPMWKVFRLKYTSDHRWGWFPSMSPRAYTEYPNLIMCMSFEDLMADPRIDLDLQHYLLLEEI